MDKRIELLIKYYDEGIVVPAGTLISLAELYPVKDRSLYKIFSLDEEDEISLSEFKQYIQELIKISRETKC